MKAGVVSFWRVDDGDVEEVSVFTLFVSLSSSIDSEEEVRLLDVMPSKRDKNKSENLNEFSSPENKSKYVVVSEHVFDQHQTTGERKK